MKQQPARFARASRPLFALLALAAAGYLTPTDAFAGAVPALATTSGTVLQTNLVSDLPGVATALDPNLVNSWGVTESSESPFWISDNGAGLTTLYQVPGASNAPVSIVPLAVHIPIPTSPSGGTPTGTVFDNAPTSSAFQVRGPNKFGQTTTAPAVFLFATEDGTIDGWDPNIDPTGEFSSTNEASTHAVVAIDNSGNNFTNPDPNQQTGAVYKGLAMAASLTPILTSDANSTALLYASNFRAGTIEVYDTQFDKVTSLPSGAFQDPQLPANYAPFNVQVLNGKVYVDYARQDAAKHDDVAGPHHGFVDVFNLDGTPGLPGGVVRLVSRGPLDSPWGLAIAPPGFAGLNNPSNNPVLLVGNFGNGFINAFDATTGAGLGQLRDPDGEPVQIDGLRALTVGNNGVAGGAANTVYFTAGPFNESHGLFGALTTAAPGSPEGPAEAQWLQANVDVVQLDVQQLVKDTSAGAPASTITQDTKALHTDLRQLVHIERALAKDTEPAIWRLGGASPPVR